MTPSEFKSWFDGFTEALTGVPTKAQWARIKERVAEIDGRPVSERVYIDRYWPRYLDYRPWWVATSCGGSGNIASSAPMLSSSGQNSFDGLTAMNALGRAEAQNMAA